MPVQTGWNESVFPDLIIMKKIDGPLLNEVSAQAKKSPRRRMNYNFHSHASDTLHRMLNAIEPQSYVQPHKHENPDKREAFFVLRGRIVVVEFDPDGNITDHIVLDPCNGCFGVEIAARTFHSIIALDPGTVAYEVKDGPWNPTDDKHFASWAPAEGEAGTEAYNLALLRELNIEY